MSVIFHPFEQKSPFAVMALNKTLPKFFADAWSVADLRICSDKGSKLISKTFPNQTLKQPNIITCSSQDSFNKLKQKINNNKTDLIKYEDNSKTDVAKCVEILKEMNYKHPILILGTFDERFDKTVSLLHTALSHQELRLCLIDDRNFSTWVFPKDKKILTPKICTTEVCGLLPLLKPVTLSTKGLKWDLENTTLSMGDFISSSNEIAANEIKIDTKDPILWTVEAKKEIKISQNK